MSFCRVQRDPFRQSDFPSAEGARTLKSIRTHKVGSSEVFPNDSMPKSLPWSCHPHSKRQQREMRHSFRVARHESLIRAYSGIVINVARLGQANNRMYQDIRTTLSSGSNGQLSVSSVHGITSLKSNHFPPGQFVEVCTELGRCVCKTGSQFDRMPRWKNVQRMAT